MTDSADDKNNFTTMNALVFQGPNKLAPEGRPRPNPRHDARYSALSQNEIPGTECLEDTLERFLPCWQDHIMPAVRSGKRVLIVAPGNSLRALVQYLDGVSDPDIVEMNIPAGIPLVYELDADMKPIRHNYPGDAERVRKAMQASASHVSLKNQMETGL